MSMIFFTFRAQMGAKQGVNLLHHAKIPARMGKTPSRIAGRGCGYGVWIPEEYFGPAAEKLLGAGLRYEKSYRFQGDTVGEVWL